MIPHITRDQIAELETLLVEQFSTPLSELMKLSGLRLAEFIRDEFPQAHNVLLFCGRGHNGGDGLCAAQFLVEYDFTPTIVLLSGELSELTKYQLECVDAEKVKVIDLEEYNEKVMIEKYDLIVDCLVGFGISSPPRGELESAILAINEANEYNIPILACDIPSGMDCDEGPIFEPHVIASHILSFGFPKKGIVAQGPVWVADISLPKEALKLVDMPQENYFEKEPIVKVS